MESPLEIHPLTPRRWDDLTALFGERGANSGCWCMWWRLTNKQYAETDDRKGMFKGLVDEGREPGLLGYLDGEPVGWVSVAPRAEFTRLEHSRALQAVDDTPVWSIVCFYIDRHHRKQGVASALLQAAVDYAARRGAQAVEGYPKAWLTSGGSSGDLYNGTLQMFLDAGFEEVARRKENRPIVRRLIPAG